jgi:hypothetical protein
MENQNPMGPLVLSGYETAALHFREESRHCSAAVFTIGAMIFGH